MKRQIGNCLEEGGIFFLIRLMTDSTQKQVSYPPPVIAYRVGRSRSQTLSETERKTQGRNALAVFQRVEDRPEKR